VALTDPRLLQFIQKRQIPLVGMEINGGAQDLVTSAILYLNTLGVDPIVLLIDSTGGAIAIGNIIVDAIRMSAAPIHGTVVGFAHSTAFWILQNCHRRIGLPASRMMYHGTALNGNRVDEIGFIAKAEHQKALEFLAQRTKQPLSVWRKWSRQERIFVGQEAVRFGILDEITIPPNLPGMEP
jgi:ATP-dependent protease ClpP protease subunit